MCHVRSVLTLEPGCSEASHPVSLIGLSQMRTGLLLLDEPVPEGRRRRMATSPIHPLDAAAGAAGTESLRFAIAGFLANYKGQTRVHTESDSPASSVGVSTGSSRR